MNYDYNPSKASKAVAYKTIGVDGLNIAYREAGDPDKPRLVLLHGWPSSSHHYRHHNPALADQFHVISPDYPGFGNNDTPDPASFPYKLDKFAEVGGRFWSSKNSQGSACMFRTTAGQWVLGF
jgi:pimeloyl-ACP methyl ester carboxylesterase